MVDDATMPIALSISTLHRADGLAQTLESLARQRVLGSKPDLVAVVVNNDPADPVPRRVAAEVSQRTGLSIEVLDEPKRGIAPPRNRGLAAAIEIAGPHGLVGFIDDDEEAPEGWLEELLRVKREHSAEIVTGPVEPIFESPPPAWIEQGGFFARTRLPTGARRRWAFTNNILFDAALPARLDRWFDDSFLRLGEDRHFFQRLARSGASIVWADEAPVLERIPPRRANERWLVERLRTVGRCVPIIERDLDGAMRAAVVCSAKGLVWIPVGLATSAAGAFGGKAMRVRGRMWSAYGVGLLEGVFSPSRAGRPAVPDR